MKITGIKKAVGDFKRANAEGNYSPRYGRLMLDRGTGKVWCDEFYDLGHNSWNEYHDKAVINLVHWVQDNIPNQYPENGIEVNMTNVRAWAEIACSEYAEEV